MADIAQHLKPYVRTTMEKAAPPPPSTVGAVGWIKANLFPNWWSTVLTLLGMAIIYFAVVNVYDWAFVRAVWTGTDRNACLPEKAGFEVGACWAFVGAKMNQFIYGRYPVDERWRVNIVFFIGAIGIAWTLIEGLPYRKWATIFMLAIFPIITLVLLSGGNLAISRHTWKIVTFAAVGMLVYAGVAASRAQRTGGEFDIMSRLFTPAVILGYIWLALFLVDFDFGLKEVQTPLWGGLMLTLVVAITGIVASFPLGVVLALGRRSKMPVVKMASIIFIEFWRGVPLITVLFMSSVMLPLFLPEGTNFDKLLRCLIGVALFSAAYMAEVVRGGLQAIPKGQYEGAQALGLPFWNTMNLIVLPQALKLVIPGIVNTFIGLFKDTTLVLIIGLFDLLGTIQQNISADANWFSPSTKTSGYVFAAMVFWVFCFAMSRYSIFMEKKLYTGHKR